MLNTQEIANYAQSSAKELGINQYDIYGSSIDETSVEVDSGEPKQVQASNRSSVIVRVWNEQQTVGVTTTTDLDEPGIKLALKTAKEASFFGNKDNLPEFSPEAKNPINQPSHSLVEPSPVPQLIETLIKAEKTLLEAHPAIKSVPYNGLSQEDIARFYLNSEGAIRQEARSYASIYLYSRTEEEGKKPRGASSVKISRSLSDLDIDGCLKEVTSKTISHINYQPIPSGKYRVVFSPKAFLSLIGAFSNLFNAQNILDKQSLSSPDSLGTQIASPLLCLCDDALHPDNIGAETFDDEGTPTRRVELITNGILKGLLHSTGTAKRMNAQPTGNANIGAKVTVSSHFYHVFGSEETPQALTLDTAENVILIDSLQALHAGVNALQGSFSLPFDGWLVNQGQLTSIDAATIAGDYLELLKSIIYIEPESEVTPRGVCPRVWVDQLSVTGE
ncbi:peptidase U62 modulator of DNA gyrase [Rippkaea orientalis PCC 8801]|uniref:Peptidase U62 modulator of DNA gyrase n=1 Tax=Rippkaea orientalis (strain PCC 8801 / RF-1) TaxID=41431 RepID=B7K015_RIPO1|nr:TldD/PmbA family protein [Rippkaea orientalis]ACK66162.1 peptidase U62 modulator of DNA gyrase [Rippkaea orientalis PCC 8801]